MTEWRNDQDLEPQARLRIEGIQLLLAEKRAGLSLLRTGTAVSALPLGVLSLLIATSRHYRIGSDWPRGCALERSRREG